MPYTELGVWNVVTGQIDMALDLIGVYLGGWVGEHTAHKHTNK